VCAEQVVCFAPDYELLQLADVDVIAFGFIDFLNDIPKDLNLFFFRPDCVS